MQWIKCSDKLPSGPYRVLVNPRKGGMAVAEYHKEIKYWCDVDGGYYSPLNITHWMPLPEPPEGE